MLTHSYYFQSMVVTCCPCCLLLTRRLAKDGAKVCIAAKTADPHPKLPGTIYSAAEEIEKAGGTALPVVCDVRDDESVDKAVSLAASEFGGLDVVINNASAINNSSLEELPMKRFDLMNQVNARGTYTTTRAALPHLLKSERAQVLMLSPPLNMDPRWFKMGGTGYTMAKYGMSMCVLGFAEELKGRVGVNALWPRTAIATAAIEMLAGKAGMAASRTPEIMADTAHWIVQQDPKSFSGHFLIDDEVLTQRMGKSQKDLDAYAVQPGAPLMPDFYVGDPDALGPWVAAGEAIKTAGKAWKNVASMFGGGGKGKGKGGGGDSSEGRQ